MTVTKVYCDECAKEFTSNDKKRHKTLSSDFIGSEASIAIQFTTTTKREITAEDPVTICESCAVNLLNGAIEAIEALNNSEEDEDLEND